MRIKRKCKNCGQAFMAIKTTQKFCSRKCFKKNYYFLMKKKREYAKAHPVYPVKHCDFCKNVIKLDFDPIKYPRRYDKLECPKCHVTNEMIWQNAYKSNSKQVILDSVKTTTSAKSEKTPHTHTVSPKTKTLSEKEGVFVA